jgi:hypothetical protein
VEFWLRGMAGTLICLSKRGSFSVGTGATGSSTSGEPSAAGAGPRDVAGPPTSPGLIYPPVTERRPSSWPVIVVAFLAVAALAALGYLLVRIGHDASGSAESATQPSTGPVAVGSPAGQAVSSVVSLGPGKVLTASQHVVFGRPVDTVTFSVPAQSSAVGGGVFRPRVGNLQVLIPDRRPINVLAQVTSSSPITVRLPTSVQSLNLTYVTYGAVHLSKPSSTHRAAALVTTLAVSPFAGVTTIQVRGPDVTNIGCFSDDGTASSCGTQDADGWTVVRESGDPLVAILAQIDLQS